MSETKRVLIVDDEPENRVFLKAVVESMGYDCRFAVDGFSALDKLDHDIDLVLLDIMMPGLDGYEVARLIRSGPSCRDVPIVMVSGLGSGEIRRKAFEAGANVFLSKPIDQHLLQASLRALLKHPAERCAR